MFIRESVVLCTITLLHYRSQFTVCKNKSKSWSESKSKSRSES